MQIRQLGDFAGGVGVLSGAVQENLTHKKPPPPLGTPYGPRHMLLQGPRGVRFPMSEVPLWCFSGGVGALSGAVVSRRPLLLVG